MEDYRLLNKINSPKDLKKLDIDQLPEVCDELRHFIINNLSQHPGHLGANLGVIELTVALHYVLNTPYDRLVWDVGHQAYAHKILTGRRDVFNTNRQLGGISGFPTPKESEYDTFGVGHASTSISAALGMSIAAQMKHEVNRQVVAVIGDGAMSGGLAFEGLNNVSINPNNLLIILNDNNMAIDPIHGGFNHFLTTVQTSTVYNKARYNAYKVLKAMHLINESQRVRLIRFTNSLKSLRNKNTKNNIFEGLNIRYFGPVDGHDVKALVPMIKELINHTGPKVLHIITTKGKGYKPAEKEVTTWHAPGAFDAKTGIRQVSKQTNKPPLFQETFGNTLLELAKMNDKIVGITPAMPSGCSMTIMQKEMPKRVFDVGIAEGHSVTFSAGMAKDGLIPFCNVYSTFLQRAYDNVIHDVAIQNLHVVLCIDRAGIVGNDGATHQGQFDMAYLRCIPNITIASPLNEHELRNLMYTAQLPDQGPFAIRYPRGEGVLLDWHNEMQALKIGKGQCLKEGKDKAVISVGPIGNKALKAIELVEKETGESIALYDLRFIKPLDEEMLHAIGKKFKHIYTVEDGSLKGGMGSAILEFMNDNGYTPKVTRIGLPDYFVEHGKPAELYHLLGLDTEGIAQSLKQK